THAPADAGPLLELSGRAPLGARRAARAPEEMRAGRVGAHDVDGLRQLGADGLRLAALTRKVVQGLRVRARRALRFRRPIRAMASSTTRRWSSSCRLLRTSFSATAIAISLT